MKRDGGVHDADRDPLPRRRLPRRPASRPSRCRPGAWRSSGAGSTTPRSTRCAPRWSSRATSSTCRRSAGTVVDKHSTGGVGDKVTIALAPLVAACGVPGREDVGPRARPHRRHARQARGDPRLPHRDRDPGVRRAGAATSAAPWSRRPASSCPPTPRIYALRDVTGTVPAPGLIATSRDVEEARLGRRRDGARREGRRRRVLPDGGGGARAGAADVRPRRRAPAGAWSARSRAWTRRWAAPSATRSRWPRRSTCCAATAPADVTAVVHTSAVRLLALGRPGADGRGRRQRVREAISSGAALEQAPALDRGAGRRRRAWSTSRGPCMERAPVTRRRRGAARRPRAGRSARSPSASRRSGSAPAARAPATPSTTRSASCWRRGRATSRGRRSRSRPSTRATTHGRRGGGRRGRGVHDRRYRGRRCPTCCSKPSPERRPSGGRGDDSGRRVLPAMGGATRSASASRSPAGPASPCSRSDRSIAAAAALAPSSDIDGRASVGLIVAFLALAVVTAVAPARTWWIVALPVIAMALTGLEVAAGGVDDAHRVALLPLLYAATFLRLRPALPTFIGFAVVTAAIISQQDAPIGVVLVDAVLQVALALAISAGAETVDRRAAVDRARASLAAAVTPDDIVRCLEEHVIGGEIVAAAPRHRRRRAAHAGRVGRRCGPRRLVPARPHHSRRAARRDVAGCDLGRRRGGHRGRHRRRGRVAPARLCLGARPRPVRAGRRCRRSARAGRPEREVVPRPAPRSSGAHRRAARRRRHRDDPAPRARGTSAVRPCRPRRHDRHRRGARHRGAVGCDPRRPAAHARRRPGVDRPALRDRSGRHRRGRGARCAA